MLNPCLTLDEKGSYRCSTPAKIEEARTRNRIEKREPLMLNPLYPCPVDPQCLTHPKATTTNTFGNQAANRCNTEHANAPRAWCLFSIASERTRQVANPRVYENCSEGLS